MPEKFDSVHFIGDAVNHDQKSIKTFSKFTTCQQCTFMIFSNFIVCDIQLGEKSANHRGKVCSFFVKLGHIGGKGFHDAMPRG